MKTYFLKIVFALVFFLSPFVVLAQGLPDLTASSPQQDTAVIGVAKTFTATITNNGTAGTEDSFPNLFQVSIAGSTINYLVTSNMSTHLAANGGHADISISITFPTGTPSMVAIRAYADKTPTGDQVIAESNENNNWSPWTNVTITNPSGGTVTPPVNDGSGAVAGSAQNLSGWAWSSNIGWISFNSTNDHNANIAGIQPSTINYGVNKDDNGNLTGYAWSSNIGWIQFGNLSGFPNGGSVQQNAKLNGNNLTGWARALSNGGGWDGWISLSGTTTTGAVYGVTLTNTGSTLPSQYSCTIDCVWGSDVVSWVDFSGVIAGTVITPLPDLTIVGAVTPTSILPNKATIFHATIKNQGTVSTGKTFPYFFQKATSVDVNGNGVNVTNLNSSPVYKTTTRALDFTGANATYDADSPSVSFSTAGTYYIRACADATSANATGTVVTGGVVPESNEANNCSGSWTNVTVTLANFKLTTALPPPVVVSISKGATSAPIDVVSTLTAGSASIPPSSLVSFVVKIRDVTIPDTIILAIPDVNGHKQMLTPTSGGGTAISLILNNLVKNTKLDPLDVGEYTVDITQTVTLAIALKTALQKQTASLGELAMAPSGGNSGSSTTSFILRVKAVAGPYALTVTNVGVSGGTGTVTSNPAGISCGTTCFASYPSGTSVTLTASPANGSTINWLGAGCSGNGTKCTVLMNPAKAVTVTFTGGGCTINCGPTAIPISGSSTQCGPGIKISWTPNGSASYKIFRRASDGTYDYNNQITTITDSSVSSYDDFYSDLNPNLKPNILYYYVIPTVDSNEASATSPKVCSVVNTPPTVDAGLDKVINLSTGSNSVSVTGTASDSDGTISSMVWTRISGPNMPMPVIITPSSTPSSTSSSLTTQITGLKVGTYTFLLTATDNLGSTAQDEMNVMVGVNGSCSSPQVHYRCSEGSSPVPSQISSPSKWTWKCNGSGAGFTNASCSEINIPGVSEP